MRRRKLKPFVLPTIISTIVITLSLVILQYATSETKLENNNSSLTTFVSSAILDNNIPVINTTNKIINPYLVENVTIGKNYYDYQAEKEQQETSIIYHSDTYFQNTGIDFVATDVFEVVSILNGTVTNVKEDEILGKIIEIKHDNDYIAIYQSLSETSVKKGDTISQGQVIGKSGINKLNEDLGNHLHLELYINGQVVDPIKYLDKELEQKSE